MHRCSWVFTAMVVVGVACAPSVTGQRAESAKRDIAVLVDADLGVASTVDTSNAIDREAIACLRRFFTKKFVPDAVNDYWYAPDLERFGGPYSELRYAEYDSVGELRYRPTLLAIEPVAEGRLLRVTWSEDGRSTDRCVFDFLARPTDEGVRLSFPIARNTTDWERRTFGDLQYVISPKHVFNEADALAQQRMFERLATWFEVPTFPVTYYSFTDPVDLFRAKGFHQHPMMYTIPTGGMVDVGNNVYAGNNKDIYVHEVVHLFTYRLFPDQPALLSEGLATLIGGSNERDYEWHRANLRAYLADPAIDLRDRCNAHAQDDIAGHTSVPYVIGALLCERILRTDGKQGLFKVFAAGADPWPALVVYGITPETLTAELRKELELPPVDALAF